MSYLDGEELKLDGILFVPTLKVNILSLGKLDGDGFTSTLGGGILSIFDNKGNVFSRIQKSGGSMYLTKLSIPEFFSNHTIRGRRSMVVASSTISSKLLSN